MAWREMTRVALALAALLAAAAARAPTSDPALFEAAFQGRCGEGSPCEQLCRELHDGTFECGCGPGYVLHVDGYECLELNSTKSTESSSDKQEDVLYQKDVSFSAELEIAPSNRLSRFNISERHIENDKRRLTTLPTLVDVVKNIREPNYTVTGERYKEVDGLKSLIEDGVSKIDLNIIADDKEKDALDEANKIKITTLGPSLEQKVPGGTLSPARTTAVESCQCTTCDEASCICSTSKCKPNTKIVTPRFSGASWLALRALRGAYKRVRLRLRVRPERARGVLLLTGEHDDLSGDYLALLLRNGHVELRFDCGSGAGVLRSPEPVQLGRWNTISMYRHRWDAWLKLNNGKRVRGRSKGLFSRMTFREPVWVGGAGNTTGLQSKLGLAEGLLGCVDFLRINGDTYRLVKDSVSTSDIAECAPTLAPWRPISEVTSEIIPHKPKPVDIHGIYDINDIVHFEDNDIVMRDGKDHNKLDNSLLQFKYNDVKAQFKDKLEKFRLKNNVINDSKGRFHDKHDKQFIGDKNDDRNDLKARFNDKYGKIFIGDNRGGDKYVKNYASSKSSENNALKNEKYDTQFSGDSKNEESKIVNDIDNELKNEETKNDCECQHGGGCVNRVCLCPLGYAGKRCEITLDLKVPRFNGSSYLRLPGLGNSAQSWLDIQITLRPSSGDGLVLYDAEHPSGDGDFFSLHLRDYFVEFAFDLGSGIALVRSAYPLEQNEWHRISVSRSGRRASLRVRRHDSATDTTRSVTSRGAARHLTLRQPMMLGGAPHPLPPRLALRTSFSGCVGKLVINDEELSVVSAALGGVDVDNCDETHNDTCIESSCKEALDHIPVYPLNISNNDIHRSIVPKKGFKIKYHKVKSKKHSQHNHIEKYKKKKYLASKKRLQMQNDIEKKNDIMTEGPVYDGQTYMQVKYLDTNEINWGDTNTYPSFSGKDSFIHIDDEETIKRLLSYTLDINIRFRSVSSDGLLVWSGRVTPPGDFLSLAVENSVLVFRYDLGSGEVIIIANHTKVDDGLWHRARATRNRQAGVLEVDGLGSVGKISPGKLKQLNTENGLYIGGLPSIELNTMGKYKSGLFGCVSQISLSGDFDIPLSLSKLPHTITNNVGRCTP
ncbi:pikachurin [Bicyclus anynana]|uniref:Pikachurin n=1 Tax=Bicyclus anynana TaxID=110368 RepID=A0ABM3LTJ0_BICAN|nr:pikachurin [Bicyclus anynana]